MEKLKSNIYDNGEVYDKTFRYEDDIKLWLNLTKGRDGILELCCGTGRILMSLISHYNDITGIDISKDMLAVAEAKTRASGNKIHLYKRNITRFNLGRTFNSILLINNSFNHLHTESDVLKFQACLKKHMTPETEFVLQTTPQGILQHFKFNKLVPYGNFGDVTDGKLIEVFEKAEYNRKDKLVKREWFYYKENELVRKRCIYVRFYSPTEIKKLFAKNGFYFTQVYGGYNYEPVDSSSNVHITVIKKSKNIPRDK